MPKAVRVVSRVKKVVRAVGPTGPAQAIMDAHTLDEPAPAAYDHSTFLVSLVGGISRDTKLQSNLTATTISFSDMFDNEDPDDDYNSALWTFGTETIEAGGITLFAAPAANIERMGVIKINFANAPKFDPLAWPIDANLKRPEFTTDAIYGWVFVTKNDHGLFYTWREEVA
jgi:hypothetical protein